MPRHSTLALAGVGIVFLGIGMAGGYWLGQVVDKQRTRAHAQSLTMATTDSSTAPLMQETALILERLTGMRQANLLQPQAGGPLPEEMKIALQNLLRVSNPVERTYQARRIAEALGQRQIAEAVAFVANLPRNRQQEEALFVLLARWSELDGRSATAWALGAKGQDREALVESALAGWTRKDYNGAWQWVLSNPAGQDADGLRFGAIIRTLAGENPALAFNLAASLPIEPLRLEALQAFALSQYESGPAGRVVAWMEDLPEGTSKDSMLAYTAEEWARYEPEVAAAWAAAQTPPERRQYMAEIVAAAWARSTPEKAATWALEQPFTGRAGILEAVAETWMQREGPSGLVRWLNELWKERTPDESFDPTLYLLSLELADRLPETAMGWTNAITDPDKRNFAAVTVGQQWLAQDPANAPQKIAALPYLSDAVRTLLIGPQSAPLVLPSQSLSPDEPIVVSPGREVQIIEQPLTPEELEMLRQYYADQGYELEEDDDETEEEEPEGPAE